MNHYTYHREPQDNHSLCPRCHSSNARIIDKESLEPITVQYLWCTECELEFSREISNEDLVYERINVYG